MPLPMSDVAQAYRSNPEKTEEAVHKVGGRGLGGSRGRVPPTPAAHGLLPAAAPVLSDEEPAAAHAARADLPAAAGHPHHLFRTGLPAKLLRGAALPCPRQP